MKAVRLIRMTKRYGRRLAVDSLSLEVDEGEVFGFLGPNGAGKTTTIRMMLGLVWPTSGWAELFGKRPDQDRAGALRHVGALAETPAFYPHLSGRRNVDILARLSGRVEKGRVEEALALLGLSGRAADRAGTYSHGMKQRLAIAISLVARPRLIILDEPTSGLDPHGVLEVRRLIKTLARDQGATVFLSSHLLAEVEQVCTRVAIIDRGKLVLEGDVGDILGGSIVVVADEPEKAAALIGERLGHEVEVSGGKVIVRGNDLQASRVNRLLVENGVEVYELRPRARDLEELFVSLTKAGDRC